MILEVPITDAINFTGADNAADKAYYLSDPNNPASKVYLTHKVNRTTGKLFVYPGSDDESKPSIAANEVKNFFVPLNFDAAGTQTVEARLYPMYDDEWMAIADVSGYVKGNGTIVLTVANETGAAVNADFYIDDVKVASNTNTTTQERLEGEHKVSIVTVNPGQWINTTLTVTLGDVTEYSATVVSDTGLPHITTVTGAAGDVRMMPPEVEETISETSTNHWNAAVKAKQVFNSTISSSGGIAVIAVDVPVVERLAPSLGPRPNSTMLTDIVTYSFRNTSGWQGPFNASDRIVDGVLRLQGIDTGDIDQVTFAFEGRQLGDIEKTGNIDIGDALEILWYTVGARPDWTGNDLFYADVENTGDVDIGDALEILWYTVGARDDYYQQI
jgi:hypothetical protein